MIQRTRPPALLVALVLSPTLVLALIGWTGHQLRGLEGRAPGDLPLFDDRSLAHLALERLWTAYVLEADLRRETVASLRGWLAAQGLVDGALVSLDPGLDLPEADGPLLVRRTDRGAELALDVYRGAPGALVPGASDLDVHRFPRADLVSAALDLGAPVATWYVERASWDGADFTLLGRDLSCALCHVTVRRAPGEARAARVGSLGDLVLRSDARLELQGTLHLGGQLVSPLGAPLDVCALPNLRFAALDERLRVLPTRRDELEGRTSSKPLGVLDPVRLEAAEGRLLGRIVGGPRRPAWRLPEAFPTFEDVVPRGVVLGLEAPSGISGGRGGALGIELAADSSAPGARLIASDAGAPLTSATHVNGHLWVVGTPAEPIRLKGDVLVEGDLLIAGVLVGEGTLRARGAIVLAGSLRVEGRVALVAGTHVLAGAAIDSQGLAPFAVEAMAQRVGGRQEALVPPTWVSPARIRRMGDRGAGALVIEAYVYAPDAILVVAGHGPDRGDVHIRGGLAAELVAVHAPGECVIEDDPRARALLEFRAPRGVSTIPGSRRRTWNERRRH